MEPSVHVSESDCQETTFTKVFEPVLYGNWDGLWKPISAPASEIDSNTSQWYQEKSKLGICVIGKCGEDAYEVTVDPPYLPGLKLRQLQMNVDYKVRAQWLRHAANVIRSEHHPEAEHAYHHAARLIDLHEELARAILIHDISAATASVQRKLAQNLILLPLGLVEDHNSFNAHNYLASNQGDLLKSLQLSLPIPVPPKRTKRDEAQITSLVRALLELSGGRVDLLQHGFAEEYTVSDNANLYASVLGITRTRQFGDFDLEEMRNALSKSSIFSGMIIGAQDLEEWIMKMMHYLRIGFRKGYLNLPSQVLSGFSIGQVYAFNVYLEYTYHTIPPLQKPENNKLLLLPWSTVVSSRQLNVLSEWASSEDGWNLYEQLTRDAQGSQSVEQLALTMAALMHYRRLSPDLLDHVDQPINGNYLADLDALFRGEPLGNSGRVAEQMVFALVRVLHSSADQFKVLITFVETALDREHPLLHFFDGFSDRYLRQRTHGHTHKTAILEPSQIKMPELRVDDDADWVNVTHPEQTSLQEVYIRDHSQGPYGDYTWLAVKTENSMEQSQDDSPLKINVTHTFEVSTSPRAAEEEIASSYIAAVSSSGTESHLLPPPDIRADQYTLIRLFKVEDRMILKKLDTEIGTVSEVPNFEELHDESWEICILASRRRTVSDRLGKIFPNSHVDLYHNPLEPTANDLKIWEYDTAKNLLQRQFFQRAARVIRTGRPAAGACYAYLLEVMYGFRSDQSLVPTYRGCLQSKDDTFYLLESVLRGKRVHSCRRPRDGEATISGNVFVWEENSTGIDRWDDGMKWTVREEDGFEVCEAIDGSGLMKKTISIPACGAIHHVVSYYTAGDAPNLARPSRNMTLRPELASVLTARGPPNLHSCETADKIGLIPESIRWRIPQDLLRYILKQKKLANIPIHERKPADVASTIISAGPFEIKAYFPASSSGKTVVFMHLPGGICKKGIDRDQSWCSNMAKDSESIYINVDYRSASDENLQQILTNCLWAYELVRQMCIRSLKKEWDTHPTRIVLSGSSFGATLAIIVAAIAAQNGEPAYRLILLVPLIDTDPDLAANPWGENESTLGLTPDPLLGDMKTIFEGVHPDFRDHWHSNPCKMPDEAVRMLPKMIMVFARLDILYKSQVRFKDHLQARGVEVDWIEVDGLHQVKDMDQVTEAGCVVRQYIAKESTEFVKNAKCSAVDI